MKKFLFWLIIIVIIFLLVLFLYRLFFTSTNQSTQNTAVSADQSDSVSADDPSSSQTLDDIVSNIKPSYIDDSSFRTCADNAVHSCLQDVIVERIAETGDTSLCEDFYTVQARSDCRDTQILLAARDSGDQGLCQDATERIQDACVQEATITKAVSDVNVDLCNDLEERVDNCRERVATTLAQSNNDPSFCDLLPGNDAERERCREDVRDRTISDQVDLAETPVLEEQSDDAL